MAETVDRLSGPVGRRLVPAYTDTGPAENDRTYWQDD
jgi:hypothetical protein